MPDVDACRIGGGASVYKILAGATSLQIPCRSTCGGRTLSNALFIKSLYLSTN